VEKPYERIAPLREELATTRDRPTHVTTGLRALQMVLSFVFLSVGLASMLIWSRMGAIAEVIALELAMARNAAVTQMLTDDALRAELRSELVDGHVLQNNPEPVLAQLRQRLSVDRAERDKLRRELGPVDVFAASALQQRFVDPDQPIRIERAPGEVVMFMVVRATGETEQPLELTPADINSVLHYAAGGEDPSAAALQEALLWSSVFSLSFFPVFWIVWAFLFRGPISVRVAGLALVRSDGRKAARWQCALRAFFIWAPVVIPLAIILWLDRQHLATLPMCTLLQGLSVGILVAYVVLALRFPRQSYADWLAGVQVAPR
jgi:hypothetical protein